MSLGIYHTRWNSEFSANYASSIEIQFTITSWGIH